MKGSGDFQPAGSFKKPKEVKIAPTSAKKEVKAPMPTKVQRIREHIEDDYENDGFESYHGSLKADKLKDMQIRAKKEDA